MSSRAGRSLVPALPMRRRISAGVAALALAGAAFTAHAECGTTWAGVNFTGWDQSNRIAVTLQDVTVRGTDFTGRAAFWSLAPEESSLVCSLLYCGRDPLLVHGELEGTVSGDAVRFKVYWANKEIGLYTGRISPTGRVDGENYVQSRPADRTTWFTAAGAFVCAATKMYVLPSAQQPSQSTAVATPRSSVSSARPLPSASVGKAIQTPSMSSVRASGGACADGFTWRLAGPEDRVCAPPSARSRVVAENRAAASRRDPQGRCTADHVPRRAYAADVVCVTAAARDAAQEENRLAPSRRVVQ